MSKSNIITSLFVRISQTPASIVDRVLARLIDYTIIGLYGTGIIVLSSYIESSSNNIFFLFFVLTIPLLLYDFLWESFNNGQSPGKYIMKIRVVNKDGSSPTLGSFFMRWLLSIIDIGLSGIGLLFILLTKNSQRLGDLAAGTMVIKLENFKKEHVSLDEFYYTKKDYHPIYEEAKNLSTGQAELIEKTIYSQREDREYQMASLAIKVSKFLGISEKVKLNEKSNEHFLTTILHDYQYYLMELI